MNNKNTEDKTMNKETIYSEIKFGSSFINKLKKHTEVDKDFDIVRLLSGDDDNPELCFLVDAIKKKNPVFSACSQYNKDIDKAKTDLIFKARDLLTNFVMDKIFCKPDGVEYRFGSGFGTINLTYVSSKFGDLYIELKVYKDKAVIKSCIIKFNGHEFRLVEEDNGEGHAYYLVDHPYCAGDNLLKDWESARFGHHAFKHMCEHVIPDIAMEIYKANELKRKADILNCSCGAN